MFKKMLTLMGVIGGMVIALAATAIEILVPEDDQTIGVPTFEGRVNQRRFLQAEGLSDMCSIEFDRTVTHLDTTELDSFIVEIMDTYHLPGLSACVFKDSAIIWMGAYGYANIEENIEVSDSTLFHLGSISKTVTGVALMQLWEEGLFQLDDPINDYLPFDVIHPFCPDSVITFRMILTHTCGILYPGLPISPTEGDCTIPQGQFLEDYLTPDGVYYDAERNFTIECPGTIWAYSNIGVNLVAYLVEIISGTPFDHYCEDNIFIPLDMHSTSWFLAGMDTSNIAMPYEYTGPPKNKYIPYGHFGHVLWPSGFLRSSTIEFARFVIAFMQKGQIGDVRILDSTAVELMTTVQYPNIAPQQGLIWMNGSVAGKTTWGHTGGYRGCTTIMSFCPEENTGIIILTNIEGFFTYFRIEEELYEFSSDNDLDGVVNGYDNCPNAYNPSQEDSNADGVGDACEGQRGDVNGDGEINILDVLATVNHILGIKLLEEDTLSQADCNGDGNINILDALGIVNVILGIGECEP